MPRKPTFQQLDARYTRNLLRILAAKRELVAAEDAMARTLATAFDAHPDVFRDAVIGDGCVPAYRTLSEAAGYLAPEVDASQPIEPQ
jgi:hypothetical protein